MTDPETAVETPGDTTSNTGEEITSEAAQEAQTTDIEAEIEELVEAIDDETDDKTDDKTDGRTAPEAKPEGNTSEDDAPSDNAPEETSDVVPAMDDASEGDTPAPDETSAPVAAAPPPVAEAGPRSAWPMIIAGAIVAAFGYVAGQGGWISTLLPAAWQGPDRVAELRTEMTSELSGALDTLGGQVSDLSAQIEGLPETPDLNPLSESILDLTSRTEALETAEPPAPVIMANETDLSPVTNLIAELDARLKSLEDQDRDYAAAFAEMQETAKAAA